MLRFALILLLSCSTLLSAQDDFDTWFTGTTMRIDLYHTGDDEISLYSIDEVIEEGAWPGNRINRVDFTNLGNSRFRVYDKSSGVLLYSRGFSTVFGEWQTTDEAGMRTRTMQESLRFPMPKAPVEVVIDERGKQNLWHEVYRLQVDPGSREVRREVLYQNLETWDLHIGAAPDQAFDIVILGDGYTAEEQDKLRADAQRFADAMVSHPPFNEHRELFNIRAVGVISRESGIDQPRQEKFADTALSCSFNSFDSARYVLTPEVHVVRDYAAVVPYDSIFIMFNEERYGGGGIFNAYSTFAADSDRAVFLMLHEGGHSLFGLADEYYTSQVSYNEFYPAGVEPWEPNITALLDPENIKWKEHVKETTPIPTPDSEEFDEVIGAFEGAGYVAEGFYRPARETIMKTSDTLDFKAVSSSHIVRMLRWLSDRESW